MSVSAVGIPQTTRARSPPLPLTDAANARLTTYAGNSGSDDAPGMFCCSYLGKLNMILLSHLVKKEIVVLAVREIRIKCHQSCNYM